MKDHYKWLGVSYDAKQEEIKAAYRRLAVRFHPDKNDGDTKYEVILKEINESYTILSDIELKQQYDSLFFRRAESRTQPPPTQKPYTSSAPSNSNRSRSQSNMQPRLVFSLAALAVVVIGSIISAINDKSYNQLNNTKTGEITYAPQSPDTTTNKTVYLPSPKESYEDWSRTNYTTGEKPSCYNFHAKYDYSINNHLDITTGTSEDVALKLISVNTDRCIRYIYIRGGDYFSIRNIPLGSYYLKIAYGKDWRQKVINGKCVGKFVRDGLYKKGESILVFDKTYTGQEEKNGETYNTYSYSIYKLQLAVYDVPDGEQYNSNNITENSFND